MAVHADHRPAASPDEGEGTVDFAGVTAWLDAHEGRHVEAELHNARGIVRRWAGRLARRRALGLPAARLSVPLPRGQRWLTIEGRALPVVLRREDFAGAELEESRLTVWIGRARLAFHA
jgi:hypothetical protein